MISDQITILRQICSYVVVSQSLNDTHRPTDAKKLELMRTPETMITRYRDKFSGVRLAVSKPVESGHERLSRLEYSLQNVTPTDRR